MDKLLYTYNDSEGRLRWRIEPRAILRPGDTVQYGDTFFEIDSITWSVSDRGTTMEIATVPPSGEMDPIDPETPAWPCASAFAETWDEDGIKWVYTEDYGDPIAPTVTDGVLVMSLSGAGAIDAYSPPMGSSGTVSFEVKIETSGTNAYFYYFTASSSTVSIDQAQDFTEVTISINAGDYFYMALYSDGDPITASIRNGSGPSHFECPE